MDIFSLCFVNSIVLEAQWIPRLLNERADLLSRFVDKDDWSVNPSVFRVIDTNGALTQSIGLRRITILITLQFSISFGFAKGKSLF